MTSSTDQILLHQWVRAQDPEAFRVLTLRHAGMVYATCLRILRNAHEAEEIAQESFEALVRAGDKPGAYLGAWLHRVATNLAIKRVDKNRSRAERERSYSGEQSRAQAESNAEVYAAVDEVLAALPEKARYPLVAHFLENQTHEAIAASLGVSRQTVTYRIGKGIESVRAALKRRGVITTAGALGAALEAARAQAVPESLAANLGKLALAGVTGATTETVATFSMASLLSAKAATAFAAAAVALVSIWAFSSSLNPKGVPPTPPPDERAAIAVAPESTFSTSSAPSAADTSSADTVAAPLTPAPQREIDLTNAVEVWNEVIRRNSVWLKPHVENLHYTLNMGDADPSTKPTIATRIWVSGDNARCEMDNSEEPELNTYAVYNLLGAYYLVPPCRRGRTSAPEHSVRRSFRQGTTWWSAVHAWAEQGLPADARVAESYETPGGKVLVIEATTGCRGNVGLGLITTWFGQSTYPIALARVHIRTEDFAPIEEESASEAGAKNGEILFGPVYTSIGPGQAPASLKYRTSISDGKSWTLEADFQRVGDAWLLREGRNIQDGKLMRRIWVSDISTASIDQTLFAEPTEAQIAAYDAEQVRRAKVAAKDADPKVVDVFPRPDSVNVPVDTELRIRFDRPMRKNLAELQFGEGGIEDCKGMSYSAAENEFFVSVRLTPGSRQRVIINPSRAMQRHSSATVLRGFMSEEGACAVTYNWTFTTSAATTTGAVPTVTAVSPAPDSVVGLVEWVNIAFDQAMALDGIRIVSATHEATNQSDYKGPVPLAGPEWDAHQRRFAFTVAFSPNWEGDLVLDGFRGQTGVAASPVTVHYKTAYQPFSPETIARFRRNGESPRLTQLIDAVRKARAGIRSACETVTVLTTDFAGQGRVGKSIHSNDATFKWQNDSQFYADISAIMLCPLFSVGSDGTRCWLRSRSNSSAADGECFKSLPLAAFFEKSLGFAFGGLLAPEGEDSRAFVTKFNVEYARQDSFDGRLYDVVKSCQADGKDGDYSVACGEWWFDSETHLLFQRRDCGISLWNGSWQHAGTITTTRFAYNRLSETLADSEFTPPQSEGMTSEAPEPLSDGYDHYFVTCRDGSDGRMSVRYGMAGAGNVKSSGLN